MGVVGYTDAGAPCGESHHRAHLPDCIVLEIRDRRENRESVSAILRDLQAREYKVARSHVYRVAEYECRAAVAHTYRRTSRLRDARMAQGLTQTELARRAQVVSRSLQRYEQRHRTPPDSILARLAAVLGLEPAALRG